jgi:hypothetical protein
LPFVIILEIKVTITTNPTPGDAFDRPDLNRGIEVGLATVVPYEIVAG